MQAIRPYVSKQMESVGYVEHIDPFNDENIPANLLDDAFHQMFLPINGTEKTNSSQGLSVPVQVKKFTKGYRTPEEALTQSIIEAEEIIAAMVTFGNYSQNTPKITSVLLDSLNFEPYSEESNDNVIVSVFVFNFIVYTCTE